MRGVIRGHGDKQTYHVDSRQVSEAEFNDCFPPVTSSGSCGVGLIGWKPIVSDALAVHPRQVQEATDDAKRKGVPTEFRKDGRPVLTSRSHRAAYLRAYGFYDRQAGYGDPAPRGERKHEVSASDYISE